MLQELCITYFNVLCHTFCYFCSVQDYPNLVNIHNNMLCCTVLMHTLETKYVFVNPTMFLIRTLWFEQGWFMLHELRPRS